MSEPLSKSQIRNIMRAEHKSSGITKINPGLYRALNQYLLKLHQAYLEAHAENKTQKALTLTKEIRDTERDISTIYELRERKILLMAQDIVCGGAPSLKYLFPEEKLLLLRLSSILLAMRKDIRIDFDHKVDNYIKTISKEYDLERKLFAPFRPTDPFCEDHTATEPQAMQTVSSSPEPRHDGSGPSGPPPVPQSPDAGTREEHEEPVTATAHGGDEGREDIELTPKMTEIETSASEPSTDPMQSGDERSSSERTGEGYETERFEEELADDEEEGGVSENGDVDEDEEDDEPESVDFLRENAVVGTLDSIPQFRGSDLHDYRFEASEIVTLPTKMAEVLEKQGKLFIIDVDSK